MTADEIKEYIDKHTKGIYVKYETVDFIRLYDAMLKVRSMLDELEQEKNMYNELEDKIVRGESIPLVANEKFIEILEKDTELEENKNEQTK